MKNGLLFSPEVIRTNEWAKIIGLSLSGCITGTNVFIGEPGIEALRELTTSYEPRTILDLYAGRKNYDLSTLREFDCIWIDLSLLPEDGENQNSKFRSLPPEVDDHKDLIHFVNLIKEVFQVPVIISIKGIDVNNNIDKILVSSADAINISMEYLLENGMDRTGFGNEPVSKIVEAISHFNTFRSKEKGIKLLISGPVRDALDVIKYRCLGVDGICPDQLIHRAIDSIDDGKDQDWAVIGEKIEKELEMLHGAIHKNLKKINVNSLNDLSRDLLRANDYHSAALSGIPLSGYGQEIPFWRH
jgi:hypothetical protein